MVNSENKRILFLTYNFPPSTGVPAYIARDWVSELVKQNVNVTVITRHWKETDNISWKTVIGSNLSSPEHSEFDGYEVWKLPFKQAAIPFNPFLSKVFTFYKYATGNVDFERDTMQFYEWISDYLKNNRYDFILSSGPPHNTARLAQRLSKKHSIKYIVDFRDFMNFKINALTGIYQPSFSQKVIDFLTEKNIRKYVQQASYITCVTEPTFNYFETKTAIPCIKILNGFKEEIFDGISSIPEDKNLFQITILGSLYPEQNIDFMIKGLLLFYNSVQDSSKIKINFLGLANCVAVADAVKKALPPSFLNITPRLTQSESLIILKQSSVLYYIGWENYKGMYSTKIFEYLGAKRNILIAPSDKDVLSTLIKSTNAGKIADTVEEMKVHLTGWFNEWKDQRVTTYYGKEKTIREYTLASQISALVTIIKNP